jgi:arylformamidase
MADAIDESLEAEFALRRRHPERDKVYARHLERGGLVRAAGQFALDVRYGDSPRSTLDVYPAEDRARVLFFIHGGYWRALDKSYVSFIAGPCRQAGLTFVAPGYELAPKLSVRQIVDQIRRAFAFMLERLAPRQVVVAGHSAGAQLAAMLALDQALRGEGPIVGFAGVSGVYDLRPLLQTSINADLHLSREEAEEASPLLRLQKMDAGRLPPLLALVGGEETNGFKRWTTDFAAAWRAGGGEASLMNIDGATHFTILDHLANADDPAQRGIVDLFPPADRERTHA